MLFRNQEEQFFSVIVIYNIVVKNDLLQNLLGMLLIDSK